MSGVLRLRAALVTVLGAPLVVYAVSALGGLTHLRSCTAARSTPFTVSNPGGGARPVVSSALVVERDEKPTAACTGVDLLAQVQPLERGRVRLILPVMNTSTNAFHASVRVRLKGSGYTVPIGRVGPGKTAVRRLDMAVPKGDSDVTAQLIVGP